MKRHFIIFVSLLSLLVSSTYSQETLDKDLNFYYIAHDRNTNVQRLSRELQQQFDNLKEYDNVGIFYLANGEKPIIIKVNTPDENEKEFSHLIGEIQDNMSFDISADYDLNRIISLFEEIPFLDDNRHLLYKTVNWSYYVTSFFWSMYYNESIIGALYWIMNMDELRKDEFYLNIIRSPEDNIEFDRSKAIGDKNFNEINNNITIVTY